MYSYNSFVQSVLLREGAAFFIKYLKHVVNGFFGAEVKLFQLLVELEIIFEMAKVHSIAKPLQSEKLIFLIMPKDNDHRDVVFWAD